MTDAITGVLRRAASGDPAAPGELLALVYEQLRALAHARLRRFPEEHTMQATALVHEAWLKLDLADGQDWDGRQHFFGAAARAMRNLLVDAARRRARRGVPQPLDGLLEAPTEATLGPDLVALDAALAELEREFPRPGQIVMLRFFGGRSIPEIAELLGTSPRTVDREWAFARTWLGRALGEGG